MLILTGFVLVSVATVVAWADSLRLSRALVPVRCAAMSVLGSCSVLLGFVSAAIATVLLTNSAAGKDETPPPDVATTPEIRLERDPAAEPIRVEQPATDLPSWVNCGDQRDQRVGAVHTSAVASDPYLTIGEASRALDEKLKAKTDEYIQEHLGANVASKLINYNVKEIKTRLLRPENIVQEVVNSERVGRMNQMHALLEFDERFRNELDERWTQIRATSRLLQVGLGGGIVLGLLTLLFSYLRIDTATRGYYTGRLQFFTAGAILALVAASVFLARLIPWI